jgi:hypothetical protein
LDKLFPNYRDNAYLKFVKMDSKANEVKNVVPPTFPYIIIYPMNKKEGVPFNIKEQYDITSI